ncbi:MAG: hypothetical protein GXP56_13735 [Deltaproteobacteria bacterium]|nr:hypothetical protein [Deltaproteobacteria bacterium]
MLKIQLSNEQQMALEDFRKQASSKDSEKALMILLSNDGNGRVTVYQKEGEWTYFSGDYPIYSHRVGDQSVTELLRGITVIIVIYI